LFREPQRKNTRAFSIRIEISAYSLAAVKRGVAVVTEKYFNIYCNIFSKADFWLKFSRITPLYFTGMIQLH